MSYIRLTVVKPRPGQEAHVEQIIRRLADLAGKQPGCLQSFILKPHDESGEVARLAIWTDEHAAEHAANDHTIMAVRSDLNQWLTPNGHVERAFFSM